MKNGCPQGGLERFLQGCSHDAYEYFGCHSTERGYRFALYAPAAQSVALVGDFNGWDENACPMSRFDSGVWTAEVSDAKEGQIYKYAVTGRSGKTVLKSDPYAFHWETGPATGSKIWDITGFCWSDGKYMAARGAREPLRQPMSIYEMHIGSWRKGENETYPWYRRAADELAEYCADMGYTHVELLPVTEYPFDGSWGYQVTGYFAPTSRYGTPQDFMYFIDRLHGAGIGVIIDWVPAHFPRDEYGLSMFDGTALYERGDPKMAAHPDWGTLIFDYAKPAVRSFLLSSAGIFLDKYHVDGLRVDAVSSMLYLGYGRDGDFVREPDGGEIDRGAVRLLRDVTTLIKSRGAISSAEESSAYPGVTAPADKGGLGFTFKWDMGFMHDTLDYFTLDPLFRKGSHTKLTFSMMYAFSEHFILAFSHDEVVHGKKSMLDKMSGDYDRKFSTLRALYAFQFAHPGKKLNFMGGEFGQFIEWDFRKELDWFLLKYPRHDEMRKFVRELNRLYVKTPSLYEQDCGWEGFKWLNVDDAERSSVAFMRLSADGEMTVCAFNFTPKAWEMRIGLPCRGRLEALLCSDDSRFGGEGRGVKRSILSEDEPFLDLPCSALIGLPPLSATYYDFRTEG